NIAFKPTWLLLRRDKTARQRSGDCSSCGTRGHWPTVSNRETNVSRNSIKHGIFSSSLLLGEESAKLYHSPFKGSHRVSRALPRARPTLTPAVFLKSNRCVFNRAVCHEKLSTGRPDQRRLWGQPHVR